MAQARHRLPKSKGPHPKMWPLEPAARCRRVCGSNSTRVAQQIKGIHGPWDALPVADALVPAVAHREFVEMPIERLLSKVKPGGVVIDVKSVLDRGAVVGAGRRVWRL